MMPPRWTTVARNVPALLIGLGVALGLHFLFGSINQPFYAKLTLDIGIAITLAVSLTMVNGFTGQFSMGHAGFMAVGGYAAAALTYYASIRMFGGANPFSGENPAGGMLSWSLSLERMPDAVGLIGRGDLLFVGACLVGGLVAAIAGYVVGLPSLRLRGDYLAIVTLGFGEIVRVLFQASNEQVKPTGRVERSFRVGEVILDPATNAPSAVVEAVTQRRLEFGPGDRIVTDAVSGGQTYIDVIPGLEYINNAAPWDLATRLGKATGFNTLPMYTSLFWTYLVVGLTLFVALRLKYSSSGRAFLSIREDEVAAEAMGINTTRYKVRAFVLASFFAGVAGALFAHQNGSINAADMGFIRSFDVIIMIVLGGLGSISGAVMAAVLLTILPELLRDPPTLFSMPGGVAVVVTLGLIAAFAQKKARGIVIALGMFALWQLACIAAGWDPVEQQTVVNGVTTRTIGPRPAMIDAIPELPLWLMGVLTVGGAAAAGYFWKARRGLAVFLVILAAAVWHVLATGVWKDVNLGEYRMLLYALALIVMMILRPQGLMGIHEVWETAPIRKLWAMMPFSKRTSDGGSTVNAGGNGPVAGGGGGA